MSRHVYLVEVSGDQTGADEIGIFGTMARAKRACRREGFTVVTEITERVVFMHRPEDADEPYPEDMAIIYVRTVR